MWKTAAQRILPSSTPRQRQIKPRAASSLGHLAGVPPLSRPQGLAERDGKNADKEEADMGILALFHTGADEETLKKHFRKLAAREHPDVSTAPDADDRFQTLTAEYTRLMEECRTGAARLELAQAWAGLGGAYLAVSVAFNDPALSALITTALGSIKLAIDASNAEGYR